MIHVFYARCSSTPTYNHGQDITDKLTKLSKIGFSMECFTADLLQLFSATVKLSTCYQFKAC